MVSEWPPVWLLFATYDRIKVALRSIKSLKKHLKYPNLHWHICDDGSGGMHVDMLMAAIGGDVTFHTREREGPHDYDVGGNINKGIEKAKEAGTDIHLMNFDDFALVEDLDLRPMVDVLDTHDNVGFVRLAYRSWGQAGVVTNYHAPRIGTDYLWLRLIREWSLRNEWATDSYLVSMQPYIAQLRFFEAHGMYPEKVHPGITEIEMNRQYIDHEDGEITPQILFPIGERMTDTPYRHIARRGRDYREDCGDIPIPIYIDTPIERD